MSTKSTDDLYAAISRIRSAPNMSAVIKAYDAAHDETTDVSAHRHQGRWQVWHGEYAGFCGSFSQVRDHLAAKAEETLEREFEEAAEQGPSKPAMVQQPAQLQQACASAPSITPAEMPLPSEILDEVSAERQIDELRAKFDRAMTKCEVINDIRSEMLEVYWASRAKRDVFNSRPPKREVHAKHVADELGSRQDAANAEMEVSFQALKAARERKGDATRQKAQQQQARDMRPPEPREIRVTALGHQGFPCNPESSEASVWIVTDGRLSRDCATHRQALDLAEDFRVWGYVVPAN